MGVCFLCDAKLVGEQTRVCSSITPQSKIPYPEKIAELLGEDFVVIVTPTDHMCEKCSSLLTHMDKLENDLKLIKNALLTYVQKKYGLLRPDHPVKNLEVIKLDDLEISQKKVPSGINITFNKENSTLATPLKILKPSGDNSSAKVKMYKCGFCSFQSKELGHVRFHMRTHNKKEDKANQPAIISAPIKATSPPKKQLYRCQVCSVSFDSRINCLDHIQKNHNSSVASAKSFINNKAPEVTTLATASEKSKKKKKTETMADINDRQINKETVNTDMNSQKKTMKTNNETDKPDERVTNGISENNEASDLDIESMLAAIHHDEDLSSNIEDTQCIV